MIDVLIPVFNAESTIAASIESILRQSLSEMRVIIINDGSTDRTGEILAKLAEEDKRILIISTENSGIVSALNTGLRSCKAKFVARHDADDIAFPDRLAQQKEYLDTNHDCVAVGASVWHIDGNGRRLGVHRLSGDAHGDAKRIPAGEPYLMHPFLMVRRSALNSVGGYRYAFHAEDTDLYWRLKQVGRLHNLEAVMGEYRLHSGSISSRSTLNGRISALNSQLSAISAVRRSEGREDLVFNAEALMLYEEAKSLQNICKIAEVQLSEDEKRYLRAAVAAKMLELPQYRSFRLSRADWTFIAGTLLRNRNNMNVETRLRLSRQALNLMRPRLGLKRLARRTLGKLS
jgi:glycosyltransferase involved in cell wall biosynthesis